MSIIEEISVKEKTLRETANEKELLFFDYLLNGATSLDTSEDNPENVLICYSAFSEKLNRLDLVKKMQGTKPIKGLHYTNNLIELIAIALHDFQSEKEHLADYSSKHSLRDAYLISQTFPEILPEVNEASFSPIDKLIDEVLIDNNMENADALIFRALEATTDLVDVYILKKSAQKYLSLHESTKDKVDIQYLLRSYLFLHKVLYIFFSIIFYIVLLSLVVVPTYLLIPFILSNWNTVEPILAIIQIIGPIVVSVGFLAFGLKFKLLEKIKPFQNKLVTNFEKKVFSLFGQDFEKVMNINARINI